MENKMLNTMYTFEFADGTTAELTLSFFGLYQLRSKDKSLYERYNKIMTSNSRGNFEELDSVTILYAAYVCANMKNENLMSEEEFIMKCGSDRRAVGAALGHLTNPKKM